MNKHFLSCLLFLSLILITCNSSYGTDNKEEDHACLNCHKKISEFYKNNVHGKVFRGKRDGRHSESDCDACHGIGAEHKVSAEGGDKIPVDVKRPFSKGSGNEAANDAACLGCHDSGDVSLWTGSVHKLEGMGCTSCHNIHGEDRRRNALKGTEICVNCHVEIRARMQRTSHMPLRSGKMSCVDCHNPHGSIGPSLLKEKSLNENCYRCHMEKRGPFIWEHAPVRENCGNCHDPHGSNQEELLTMRLPYLCQSCHSMASHSSSLYDGNALAGLDKNMVGKGCLNCHSLIHGSNHPSGSAYSR